MTVFAVTAFFSLLALTAGGGYALFSVFNSLRAEVAALRDDMNKRFDELNKEIGQLRADLARIEQKLDDHIATPHPAAHPAA